MERGLADLRLFADLEILQVDEDRSFVASTDSDRRIREFTGAPDELVERMQDVDVLLVHGAPVTDQVLDASSQLRLVGCARGGPVNVDVHAASARRIPVVNTPGKNAEAVADEAIALLIMLARGLRRAMHASETAANVGASTFEGAAFLGHELGGHTLGLVDYGQVGRRVAARAIGFGMQVLAYDPFAPPGPDEPAAPAPSLEHLLEQSDFVSLHARATPDTENLLSAEEFARMRPGAFLVNTARETLIDEAALDTALASGHLAGAGLDVVRPHSGGGRHPLLRHDGVVLLPHIGGATHETLERGVRMLATAVSCLREGVPLPHVVNASALT